ncbi:hypothetical protein, partial [Bradyrhizobium sp.]|uniref:hypothetical protein n=1 Tax=Bradyrhizobium sp. TaxID=376 RepID=UPI003C47F826
IMLVKTFTWHSLAYIVGIASTIAVHQVVPSPGSPAGFQSGTTEAATTTGQIANRSAKSDRLPIKESNSQANDKAPLLSVPNVPNRKLKGDCKPPIDVPGRCFADARANRHVT